MERTIAEAPQAHRNPRGRNGGNNNNGGMPAPGPTARRRLIHSFRTFLGQEEEFFRVLLGRLAASLYPADLAGLRSLGVVVDRDEGEEQFEAQRTDEERKARRNRAVPLAHKALICFGDLARYRELYNEPGGGPAATGKKDGGGKRGGKGKAEGGERKPKNWARAAECYHQARLLLPDNGELSLVHSTLRPTLILLRARRQSLEPARGTFAIRRRPPLLDLSLLSCALRSIALSDRAHQPRDHVRESCCEVVLGGWR
jgi:hypothetical protein